MWKIVFLLGKPYLTCPMLELMKRCQHDPRDTHEGAGGAVFQKKLVLSPKRAMGWFSARKSKYVYVQDTAITETIAR